MRPVFSNISYFLETISTFFYLPYKFVWVGILRPLRNLKILIGKFFLMLAILSKDAPKE